MDGLTTSSKAATSKRTRKVKVTIVTSEDEDEGEEAHEFKEQDWVPKAKQNPTASPRKSKTRAPSLSPMKGRQCRPTLVLDLTADDLPLPISPNRWPSIHQSCPAAPSTTLSSPHATDSSTATLPPPPKPSAGGDDDGGELMHTLGPYLLENQRNETRQRNQRHFREVSLFALCVDVVAGIEWTTSSPVMPGPRVARPGHQSPVARTPQSHSSPFGSPVHWLPSAASPLASPPHALSLRSEIVSLPLPPQAKRVVFDDATVKRIVERCRKTRASMQPFVGFFDAAALPCLDLSECRLGRGTVIPFHEFSSLTELNLASTDLGMSTLKLVGCLPGLVKLNLSNMHLNDEHLVHVAKLARLRELKVARNVDITNIGANDSIAKLSRLEVLDVQGTSIFITALCRLVARLPDLRFLRVAERTEEYLRNQAEVYACPDLITCKEEAQLLSLAELRRQLQILETTGAGGKKAELLARLEKLLDKRKEEEPLIRIVMARQTLLCSHA